MDDINDIADIDEEHAREFVRRRQSLRARMLTTRNVVGIVPGITSNPTPMLGGWDVPGIHISRYNREDALRPWQVSGRTVMERTFSNMTTSKPSDATVQAPITVNAPTASSSLTPSLVALLSHLSLQSRHQSPLTSLFFAERLFTLMPQAELTVWLYAGALKACGETAEAMRILREGLVKCTVENFKHTVRDNEEKDMKVVESENIGKGARSVKGKGKEKEEAYILAPVPVNTLQNSRNACSNTNVGGLSSFETTSANANANVNSNFNGQSNKTGIEKKEEKDRTVWNFPAEVKVFKYPLGIDALSKLQYFASPTLSDGDLAQSTESAGVVAAASMDASAFDTMSQDILGSLPKFPASPTTATLSHAIPTPITPAAPTTTVSTAGSSQDGAYILLPSFLHSGLRASPILESVSLPNTSSPSKKVEQRASQKASYLLSLPTPFLRPAIEVSLRCCILYAECCAEEPSQAAPVHGLEEKRTREGLEYLEKVKRLWDIRNSGTQQKVHSGGEEEIPQIPFGVSAWSNQVGLECSLARLAIRSGLMDRAEQHYKRALEGEGGKWCWEAIDGLAKLGKPLERERMEKMYEVEKVPAPSTGIGGGGENTAKEFATRKFVNKKFLKEKEKVREDQMDVDSTEEQGKQAPKSSKATSSLKSVGQFTFTSLPLVGTSTATSTGLPQPIASSSSSSIPTPTASGVPRQAGNKRPRSAAVVPSRTVTTHARSMSGIVGRTTTTASGGATGISSAAAPVRRSTRLTASGATVGVGISGARTRVVSTTRERKRAKPGGLPIGSGNVKAPLSSGSRTSATSPQSETDSLYHTNLTKSPPMQTRPMRLESEPLGVLSEEALIEGREAEGYLGDFVRRLATVVGLLEGFRCKEALKELEGLGEEWRKCWRIYELIGRANMELVNYEMAEKAYLKCRSLAPRLVSPLPLYSTLLWHLQKPVALSALAQDTQWHSRSAPQTWIVCANLFSYLSDTSNTLRSLDRARECFNNKTIYTGCGWNLSDECYSLTLSGHECVAMMEYERGIGFYREALRRNGRHYNAWFGLGNCFEKMGKHKLAGYHFARAREVNETNAIILSSLAGSFEQQGKFVEALETVNKAIELQPNSPAIKFRKLTIMGRMKSPSLFGMLKKFVEETPQEPTLHMMFAKLCLRNGNHALAKRHFAIAADLDSSLLRQIKEFENKFFEDRSTLGI